MRFACLNFTDPLCPAELPEIIRDLRDIAAAHFASAISVLTDTVKSVMCIKSTATAKSISICYDRYKTIFYCTVRVLYHRTE